MEANLMDFESILPYIGEFGRFQAILQVMYCIALIPAAYPTLIMYFAGLEPDWKCVANSSICLSNGTFPAQNSDRCNFPRDSWEYTQPSGYSIVTQFDIYCSDQWKIYLANSIMFLACPAGAVTLGWGADLYGRKRILFPSLTVIMLAGFACSFSPNIWVFILCRFAVGFFIPGAQLQIFVLLSEMAGSRYRAKVGIGLWAFFTVALVLLGVQALVFPRWQTLFILCTAPYLFVPLFYFFVPESVKWLLAVGRTKEAMAVVRRVARCNGKNLSACLRLNESTDAGIRSSPMDLFASHSMTLRTLNQGLLWLAFGMLYHGLSLAANDLGGSLYTNYMLVAAVEFPAVFLAMFSCDAFGRKKTVAYSFLLGGIACALVAAVPVVGKAKSLRVFFGSFGKFCVTISYDSAFTWSAEMHPTRIRSTAMGVLQVASRLGEASAPWVAKGFRSLHPALPFVIMGTFAIISASCSLLLPETKGRTEEEEVLKVRSYEAFKNIDDEVV